MYFSDLLKSSSSFDKFVGNLVDAVKEYNLDGLNLDWGTYYWKLFDIKMTFALILVFQNILTALTVLRAIQSMYNSVNFKRFPSS